MTKLYTLLLVGCCAFGMSAQKTISEIPYSGPERTVRDVRLTEVKGVNPKTVKARAAEDETNPSFIGKQYVTLFHDWDIECNGQMEIEKVSDDWDIVLKNFAGGYDVYGTYYPLTGTIVIPVDVSIGKDSQERDIMLYSLISPQTYSKENPIVARVNGSTIEFENGAYCSVGDSGMVLMYDIVAKEANASIGIEDEDKGEVRIPLLVSKVTEDEIEITGISNLMFGARCPLTFLLDESQNLAVCPYGEVVDKEFRPTGTYRNWLCGSVVSGGVTDLILNVSTTESSSILSTTQLFYGYENGSNFTGYNFSNVRFYVDFNVFTAKPVFLGPGMEINLDEWTEIGKAKMIDGWITPVLKNDKDEYDNPEDYPITAKIARNNEDPNLLVVINPYVYGSGFPLVDDNSEGYIVLDVSDPDFVIVTTGVFCGMYNGDDAIFCTNAEGFYTAAGFSKELIQEKLSEDFPVWSSLRIDADGYTVIDIPTSRFVYENDLNRLRSWTGRADAMKSKIIFKEYGEGVSGVEADYADAPVEFFNLQGVKVASPENGIFIRRQGDKVSKITVK